MKMSRDRSLFKLTCWQIRGCVVSHQVCKHEEFHLVWNMDSSFFCFSSWCINLKFIYTIRSFDSVFWHVYLLRSVSLCLWQHEPDHLWRWRFSGCKGRSWQLSGGRSHRQVNLNLTSLLSDLITWAHITAYMWLNWCLNMCLNLPALDLNQYAAHSSTGFVLSHKS